MVRGTVDILSDGFAIGWAEEDAEHGPSHVYATLDSHIIGFARSDIARRDLEGLAKNGSLRAKAFAIMFDNPIPHHRLPEIGVFCVGSATPLPQSPRLRYDREQKQQIFILGSPRSGTSELAATLSAQLQLPWLGEVHAASHFAAAAHELTGDATSPNDILAFMGRQQYRRIAVDALRRAYYFMHGSTSFLDKTPGQPTIQAAPFLAEAFPEARFIYMRRNGISNVLSRMAKFNGPFDQHCADWAAAMDTWAAVKGRLSSYIEIDQEEMLNDPEAVAEKVTLYLDVPDLAQSVAVRLMEGRLERTGAGLGRGSLSDTGWTAEQVVMFKRICGATMVREGYEVAS